MSELNHLNKSGEAHMVNVGDKTANHRFAEAGGHIEISPAAFAALIAGNAPKGDVLSVARLAAIMACKRTADWIPLCHPLPLESITVELKPVKDENRLYCKVGVSTTAKTGVEMEALVGVQAALLTVYDMLKAIDRKMIINNIRLLKKQGGKSGDFVANDTE